MGATGAIIWKPGLRQAVWGVLHQNVGNYAKKPGVGKNSSVGIPPESAEAN